MSIHECQVIQLNRWDDQRGRLVYIEGGQDLPFDIKRIYYLYDVPDEELRGCHAHIKLQQLVVAISGSFDLLLDDGKERKTIHMNDASRGVLVRPMIWREVSNFSDGAVCMVLASRHYEEEDYIGEYEDFRHMVG